MGETRYILVILLLASLLPGCTSLSGSRSVASSSITSNSLALGNQYVVVENGSFVFRNVMLDGDTLPGSWIVKGFVRNSTDKDWERVIFYIHLYDVAGNTLGRNINFIAHSLKRGQEQDFSTNYINFSGVGYPPASVSKYEVSFEEQLLKKYKFIMIKPFEDEKLSFEDKFIRIIFSISREQIGFIISNKGNSPIRIDWNQCSYVDTNGLAHSVIHTGVRYLERDKPQVPTVIPPSAMIKDIIVPSDYIDYTSGAGGGWKSKPFFPGFPGDPENNPYVGKLFSIFMPLEIEGQVRNYSFAFRIETEPL